MTNILDPSTPRRTQTGLVAEGPVEFREFLNSIFYYRRPAMLITLAVLALGILAALFLPPSYMARARLLTLNAGVYDIQSDSKTPQVQDPAAAVNVEMQLLASSELHRAIVRTQLGPDATPDAVNRQVRRFEDHLHISKLESSNVIELDYTDRDPEQAASALRLLLSAYFKQRADVLTSGRVAFLTDQRDKVKAQLDETNAQIADFEKQNGVVDIAAQVSGAVELDDRLHQDQQESEVALADSQKSVMVLLNGSKDVPRQVELFTDNTEAAHTIGTMQASLIQLEERRADLASRYMAGSPFVQHVDAQIKELKASIVAQQGDLMTAHRTGYNTYHDTVEDRVIQGEAKLAGASARRSVLNGQVAASGNHLKSLVAISDTLSRLHMQRDMLADTVKNDSAQLEQARVEENQATTAGSTNVRVIEAPVPPTRRTNPPLLIIAASLVSGILIAVVAVFILSSLRETFLSTREAERELQVPVLCDLPRRAGGIVAVRRNFGRLIAAIDSQPSRRKGKVILLLTPHSETELDLTAQRLAAAVEHRAPGRVALLRLEESDAGTGNGNGAARPTDGIRTSTLNIDASRERLEPVLNELCAAHAYVLVTAPPTSLSFQSVEVSPLADFVLLVLEAERTRRPVAAAVIAQVAEMGADVAGLVMTGRRHHIPKWIYNVALHEKPAVA